MEEPFLKARATYKDLFSDPILNFDKFNQYAIVHHSNSIEGSTLTLAETFLLLDEDLTPSNKPFDHSLMAKDHLTALRHVLDLATRKVKLTLAEIQHISSLLLKNTGGKHSTMGGDYDTSPGEFRKARVRAGNRIFVGPEKVVPLLKQALEQINTAIDQVKNPLEIYNLSFDAHFQVVSIHPFGDGNGRLSRLLMNYIQQYHQEPLTVVFQDSKSGYYEALENTRKTEDINVFRRFMYEQAEKYLAQQVALYKEQQKQSKDKGGFNFLL